MLSGRQVAWYITKHFRITQFEGGLLEFQDLLNAENRDLEVVETEQKGICVKECTVRGPFTDPNEVLEHYAEGKDNRTNAMSDFGPASRHASAVFQLDLTQATEDPSGDPKKRQTCLLYTSPSPPDGLLNRMPSCA